MIQAFSVFILSLTLSISPCRGVVTDVPDGGNDLDAMSINFQTASSTQFSFDVLPALTPDLQAKFVLRFRIRSDGETHVALSTPNRVQMYDVVFGMNRNRYTSIQKCNQPRCDEMAAVIMRDAVSADQAHDLWIGYDYNDMLIQVGRGVDDSPYLEWKDDSPFAVSELGFSTRGTEGGHWWFPPYHLQESCGTLEFEGVSMVGYRYSLPLIPVSSARDVEFDFFFKGGDITRILLSPTVGLDESDAAYEITFGEMRNSKVKIRRCTSDDDCCGSAVGTSKSAPVVSRSRLRRFTVRYYNGLLEVFKDTENIPLVTYRDPDPLDVRAIGFMTSAYMNTVFEFPVQGITSGMLVVETKDDDPYHLDLPLVPESKSRNIDFTFLVQAEQSAVIILSPSVDVNHYEDKEYEIVFGAWDNERTLIRLCKKCATRAQYNHQPLDSLALRSLRITYHDGLIELYDDVHAQDPFLSYRDSAALDIRALGFTTVDTTGRFVFATCNMY